MRSEWRSERRNSGDFGRRRPSTVDASWSVAPGAPRRAARFQGQSVTGLATVRPTARDPKKAKMPFARLVAVEDPGELGSVAHVQAAVEAGQVGLDGLDGQEQ